MFFPAWPHKSPSAYTYHITASMPFGNYMSSPLVLFPSDVTCPSHWFCSLRMLHVLSSASVPFGNSADHCFSSSPHTASASSQVPVSFTHLLPMMISNMAAGNVSIELGLRGKCTDVVTACASGTHSIGDAFRAIQYHNACAFAKNKSVSVFVKWNRCL